MIGGKKIRLENCVNTNAPIALELLLEMVHAHKKPQIRILININPQNQPDLWFINKRRNPQIREMKINNETMISLKENDDCPVEISTIGLMRWMNKINTNAVVNTNLIPSAL